MKFKILNTLFILQFPILLFSQNNFFEKDSITDLLVGKWTWEYSYGGIAGITITPETAGYDRTLLFENDTLNPDSLIYHSFINDSLIKYGKTKIRKDSSVYPDTMLYFYRIYEDLLNTEDWIIYDVSFDQDTLNLVEYCVDCFWHYYKKDTTLTITPHSQNEDIIKVYIYPNPVKQFLYIQSNSEYTGKLLVELINLSGQVKKKLYLKHDYGRVDLSGLTKGMYFLRLESEEFRKIEKIIIL